MNLFLIFFIHYEFFWIYNTCDMITRLFNTTQTSEVHYLQRSKKTFATDHALQKQRKELI